MLGGVYRGELQERQREAEEKPPHAHTRRHRRHLLATGVGVSGQAGVQTGSNCGTKGEADFGIAPHFLGFLDPKSHVIWASQRGCDFIEAIYKREGADFDIAPI